MYFKLEGDVNLISIFIFCWLKIGCPRPEGRLEVIFETNMSFILIPLFEHKEPFVFDLESIVLFVEIVFKESPSDLDLSYK